MFVAGSKKAGWMGYALFPGILMAAVLLVMSIAPPAALAAAPTVSSAVNYWDKPWGARDAVVTITGTGFTGVTAVEFGGIDAHSYTVDSDTKVTATAPAQAGSGPVHVTVTTGEGPSAESDADLFTYLGSEELVHFWCTSGGLNSAYDYNTTSYSVNVIWGKLNLGYYPADPDAVVTFNKVSGNLTSSSHASGLRLGYSGTSYPDHGVSTMNIEVTAPGNGATRTYTVTVHHPPNSFNPSGGSIDTTTQIAIDTTGMSSSYQCWYTVTPGDTGTDPSQCDPGERFLYDGTGFSISAPGEYTVMAAVNKDTSWGSPLEAAFTVAGEETGEDGDKNGDGGTPVNGDKTPTAGDKTPGPGNGLPKTQGSLPLLVVTGAAALAAGASLLNRRRR